MNPTSADFANMQNENPLPQKSEDKDTLLVSSDNNINNNYNETVPEKPYYEQNSNQNSAYIPPQFQVYQKPSCEENQDQNPITPPPQPNYEANNINMNNTEQNNLNTNNNGNNYQYPQNPPSDNNQNDIGYSSGGNGIYQ